MRPFLLLSQASVSCHQAWSKSLLKTEKAFFKSFHGHHPGFFFSFLYTHYLSCLVAGHASHSQLTSSSLQYFMFPGLHFHGTGNDTKNHVHLFIYLSIYLSLSLSIYLSIYLPIYLSIYISISLSLSISQLISIYLPLKRICILQCPPPSPPNAHI